MDTIKILLWDIETSHNLIASFSLWERGGLSIPHQNIIQERYIICASWKLLGSKTVHSVATTDNKKLYKSNPHDDSHVVKTLHKALSEADVIVAHNGDQYDIKFFKTRALALGLPPLPPIVSIDTLKVAKQVFLFNSNRLDYLGHFLGVGRKIDTSPGLWLRVLAGDSKAVNEMVDYNIQDVMLLEDVFLKLQPHIPNHVNRQLFDPDAACPRCDSKRVQSRGVHRAISRVYQRFQCQGCGGWFRKDKAQAGSSAKTRVL